MPVHKSTLHNVSYFALLAYFAVQPFCFSLSRIEIVGRVALSFWAILFLTLTALHVFNHTRGFGLTLELRTALAWILWLAGIYASAVSKGNVYSNSIILKTYLEPVAILPLIMARGLSIKELNGLLTGFVLLTPLGVMLAYRNYDVLSVAEAVDFAREGRGLAYNTFVPYVTFGVFSGIYLSVQVKHKVLRAFVVLASGGLGLFILGSPSRQSFLFLVLGAAVFLAAVRQRFGPLFILVCIGVGITLALRELDMLDRSVQRFLSSDSYESIRTELWRMGIDYIGHFEEWIVGVSFTTDPVRDVAPHNNYIFSVIRMGLIGAVLMFLPHMMSLIRALGLAVRNWTEPWFDRGLFAYAAVSLLFTLFHSVFGYPHLDVCSAPVVWFGLCISVCFQRETLVGMLRDRVSRSSIAHAGETLFVRRGWGQGAINTHFRARCV